jgi:ankyrin repeat protein
LDITLTVVGVFVAAYLLTACGCTGASGEGLTAQDIGVSVALAQLDKDGFPHAFRITFENKSDHVGILPLHGTLQGREDFIPSSVWLSFQTADGKDLTLTYTYGKKPKGELVRLKAGEKVVREYPAADFCLWGPSADNGPNPDYPFGRYFKPGQKELKVQAAYMFEPSEEGPREMVTVLSEAVTMRCSYDESAFPQQQPDEPVGTPLHQAVRRGDAAAVERLLAEGADVNAPDKYDSTPLHVAAEKGNVKVAEMLLARGASLTARDGGRNTPLDIAAFFGKVEVVNLLIAKGADVRARNSTEDGTAIEAAAAMGHLAVVQVLLAAAGADPNARDDLGGSALIEAAWHGHVEIVRFLLDKGVDVNCKGFDGMTPLHCAAEHGHNSVVELLLARGADINAKDDGGKTPMAYAAENRFTATVKLLREHGGTR